MARRVVAVGVAAVVCGDRNKKLRFPNTREVDALCAEGYPVISWPPHDIKQHAVHIAAAHQLRQEKQSDGGMKLNVGGGCIWCGTCMH